MAATAKKAPAAKRPAKRIGRPSLLTSEVEEVLFRNRELGLSWRRCCDIAGVEFSTLMGWGQVAKRAKDKPGNKRTAHEQKCLEFSYRMAKVDQEWIRRCETVLALAMTPAQNSQAWREASQEERRLAAETARWKLAHQAAPDYSTQTRTEVTGADGGPVELSAEDAWAILQRGRAVEEAD